jgi:pyruvate kinase
MPKTKIVCTLGPASDSPAILKNLVRKGMNVARLNFSHGTHEQHLEKIRMIRAVSQELRTPVAILQDLCGPKIRVGKVPDPGIHLKSGQKFLLTSEAVMGTDEKVSVSYADLPAEVSSGDRILLADGMMELIVDRVSGKSIYCDVVTGGILTSHKGINLPSGTISAQTLTEKDREDLAFGLDNGVDFLALSFVREKNDILAVKDIIAGAGMDTPVIAKIEKHEALDHIDDIMETADGVMVARGDLGVEIPLENVPIIQKMLVSKANALGKPVIIATQMLRSMVDSPRPTRAEATDVANAILDGADAIMLSEETASGNYPVSAVECMVRIAESAEKSFPHEKYLKFMPNKTVSESVAHASCVLAEHLNASAILATTRSGSTAVHIAKFRPNPLIIALSPNPATVRRLSLHWGCVPYLIEEIYDTDEMMEEVADFALNTDVLEEGDLVVMTAGHPVFTSGTTNMLKVKRL